MLSTLQGAGVINSQKQAAAQPFDQAWRALKADSSLQFELAPAPPPAKPPEWLEALGRLVESILRPIGRFLSWLFSWLPDAAYARGLLIVLLVAGAAALAWMIWVRVKDGRWQWPWRRATEVAQLPDHPMEWQPEELPARAWLEEAEALAQAGRYAEAVHCLLLRSVEDIARRRPDAIRPALTSRELTNSALLPDRARSLFGGLARLVEQSLFGGRPVGASGWEDAREAYSQFALAGTWRR